MVSAPDSDRLVLAGRKEWDLGAFDVGVQLGELHAPLAAASHADGSEISAAHEGVGLGPADRQHGLDVLEGHEAALNAHGVSCPGPRGY